MSRSARLRRVASLEIETADPRAVWEAQVVLESGGKAGEGLAWRIAVQFRNAVLAIDTTPGMMSAPLEHFSERKADR